jgi:ABC-type tungstate transport system permease subunit
MTVTSDTSILSTYFRIFVSPQNEKHIPIIAMEKFIKEIRKDLGAEIILPEEYKLLYIVLPSNQDSVP